MDFNEVILGQPYSNKTDESELYVFTEKIDGKYRYIYRHSDENEYCFSLRSVGINEWYSMNKITNDHLYVYYFLKPAEITERESRQLIRFIFQEYHEL
jgi:hypothetical protein